MLKFVVLANAAQGENILENHTVIEIFQGFLSILWFSKDVGIVAENQAFGKVADDGQP